MKCNEWARIETHTNKSGSKTYKNVHLLNQPPDWPIPDDAVRCGGRIIARVFARDDPYFGGTSAELVVEYERERCRAPISAGFPTEAFPHFNSALPNKYNISEWLTEQVANMLEEEV